MVQIGPSMMCADMSNLKVEMEQLEKGGVDYYHFDIMDGEFVPNFTMGPDLIHRLRKLSSKPFDVHLMVVDPERYIDTFIDAGADMISVHAEATKHLQRTLQSIRDKNILAGVALNPSTPLSVLDYVYEDIDYICIMSVNPGFAGQTFLPTIYKKIEQLKQIINENNYPITIQVDGNMSYETIPKVIDKGANMIVCGTSSIFSTTSSLKDSVQNLQCMINKFSKT
ncbi:ribulose-phosphate 3-epimerase [Gracilibacillus sp. YIM 98692]|uniref:ribulose-phosphate 3-epimerase n=1 Tax=Gracilibacillus sp. YIM 98692 TaxID=2663532 RepID=UPI0013D6E14F|nr:ribulose-phosphate 3-epimerase [Gracilibacillus sp. YIM 98692]